MKIKLDENIGRRGIELLKAAGHDVLTVRDQGLQGAHDEALFKVCAEEERVLLTLDHDFGQVLRFSPEQSAGLVVLEPRGAGHAAIVAGPSPGFFDFS
jgi:predicted nuclease of predicted toxin-antitoxin system